MRRKEPDVRRIGAGVGVQAIAVCAGLLAIPQAFIVGDLVATVALGPDHGVTALSFKALLIALALAGVLRVAADTSASHWAALAAIGIKESLRRSWVSTVAGWSPLAGERASAGEVATTIVDRVEAIDPWLVRYPLVWARLAIVPAVIVAAIVPVSWLVALILCFAAPLLPVLMSLIGSRARELGRRQIDETAGLTGLMLDRVRGLATLRGLGAIDFVAEEIAAAGERVRRDTMAVLKVAFLSSAVLEFFASIGIAMVAIFVGMRLIGWTSFGGDFGLAGGVAVLMLAPEFFQPFRDFAVSYHDKATALSLADRAEVTFAAGSRGMLPRWSTEFAASPRPAIVVQSLTLRSEKSATPQIEAFSLAVSPGEHVAIVGPSGAGKTSLLVALAGLADDFEGEIVIDGHSIRERGAPTVAWISQEPFITQGSLLSNLGGPSGLPTRSDAVAALALVGLDAVVRRMPRGLLTALGETGAGLSRGELRRVTIARALLSGSDLILADEPTADLDAATAKSVGDALIAAAKGRTLIVATHDEDLAARMGRQVSISRGRLVADTGAGAPA